MSGDGLCDLSFTFFAVQTLMTCLLAAFSAYGCRLTWLSEYKQHTVTALQIKHAVTKAVCAELQRAPFLACHPVTQSHGSLLAELMCSA